MTIVDELYEKFKCYDHVTPLLVMKHTKRTFEFCQDISDEILDRRRAAAWRKMQEVYYQKKIEKGLSV